MTTTVEEELDAHQATVAEQIYGRPERLLGQLITIEEFINKRDFGCAAACCGAARAELREAIKNRRAEPATSTDLFSAPAQATVEAPVVVGAVSNLWRKRPVTIEAVQFTEELAVSMLVDRGIGPFGLVACGDCHPARRTVSRAWITIKTLEGTMRADVGDWIIRGVKGELYPCKPDIFAATYEPARVTADAPSNLGAGGSLEPHTAVEAPVGFTPGPWRLINDEPFRDELDNFGWPVTAMQGPIRVIPATANSLADARLIAMAPTLLEERNRLRDENIQLRAACGYPIPADAERLIMPNPFKCGTCDAKTNELAERNRLREALEEIAKGEGRFSRDPFQHAQNTIEDMIAIAREALGAKQP